MFSVSNRKKMLFSRHDKLYSEGIKYWMGLNRTQTVRLVWWWWWWGWCWLLSVSICILIDSMPLTQVFSFDMSELDSVFSIRNHFLYVGKPEGLDGLWSVCVCNKTFPFCREQLDSNSPVSRLLIRLMMIKMSITHLPVYIALHRSVILCRLVTFHSILAFWK